MTAEPHKTIKIFARRHPHGILYKVYTAGPNDGFPEPEASDFSGSLSVGRPIELRKNRLPSLLALRVHIASWNGRIFLRITLLLPIRDLYRKFHRVSIRSDRWS